MSDTIDQIVRGSALPLSIIIVGVGNENFDAMEELDADDTPLWSEGYQRHMSADIVQFVSFRDCKDNPIQLARETLAEIPGQLLNYFRRKGFTPNPPNTVKSPCKTKDFFKWRKNRYIDMMVKKGVEVP